MNERGFIMEKLIPFPLLEEEDIEVIRTAASYLRGNIGWYLESGRTIPQLFQDPYKIPIDKLIEVAESLDKLVSKYTQTIFDSAISENNISKKGEPKRKI